MAEADLKPRPIHAERNVTIQQSRRHQALSKYLKPGSSQRHEPPLVPWLKLSGKWLEQAGFDPGQRVRIEVQHGRLVITHA
jgi:toxic protein SymE